VIVAHGGPANGFALSLSEGKPVFSVRSESVLSQVAGAKALAEGWRHLLATLGEDLTMRLAVDGAEVARGKAKSLVADTPKQPLEIGRDSGGAVGEYESPAEFRGAIDELRLHLRELTDDERTASSGASSESPGLLRSAILALSFDQGKVVDEAPHEHPATVAGARFVAGKHGKALALSAAAEKPAVAGKPAASSKPGGAATAQAGKPAAKAKNNPESIVKHKWHGQASLFARAMVLADQTLFVAGPPDLMDEEESFEQLTKRDTAVNYKLQQQDEAWQGKAGGVLWAIDARTGQKQYDLTFESLPTWDGLAAAQGQLFLTTIDGHVVCLKPAAP
jgi:hypothetical protein